MVGPCLPGTVRQELCAPEQDELDETLGRGVHRTPQCATATQSVPTAQADDNTFWRTGAPGQQNSVVPGWHLHFQQHCREGLSGAREAAAGLYVTWAVILRNGLARYPDTGTVLYIHIYVPGGILALSVWAPTTYLSVRRFTVALCMCSSVVVLVV